MKLPSLTHKTTTVGKGSQIDPVLPVFTGKAQAGTGRAASGAAVDWAGTMKDVELDARKAEADASRRASEISNQRHRARIDQQNRLKRDEAARAKHDNDIINKRHRARMNKQARDNRAAAIRGAAEDKRTIALQELDADMLKSTTMTQFNEQWAGQDTVPVAALSPNIQEMFSLDAGEDGMNTVPMYSVRPEMLRESLEAATAKAGETIKYDFERQMWTGKRQMDDNVAYSTALKDSIPEGKKFRTKALTSRFNNNMDSGKYNEALYIAKSDAAKLDLTPELLAAWEYKARNAKEIAFYDKQIARGNIAALEDLKKYVSPDNEAYGYRDGLSTLKSKGDRLREYNRIDSALEEAKASGDAALTIAVKGAKDTVRRNNTSIINGMEIDLVADSKALQTLGEIPAEAQDPALNKPTMWLRLMMEDGSIKEMYTGNQSDALETLDSLRKNQNTEYGAFRYKTLSDVLKQRTTKLNRNRSEYIATYFSTPVPPLPLITKDPKSVSDFMSQLDRNAVVYREKSVILGAGGANIHDSLRDVDIANLSPIFNSKSPDRELQTTYLGAFKQVLSPEEYKAVVHQLVPEGRMSYALISGMLQADGADRLADEILIGADLYKADASLLGSGIEAKEQFDRLTGGVYDAYEGVGDRRENMRNGVIASYVYDAAHDTGFLVGEEGRRIFSPERFTESFTKIMNGREVVSFGEWNVITPKGVEGYRLHKAFINLKSDDIQTLTGGLHKHSANDLKRALTDYRVRPIQYEGTVYMFHDGDGNPVLDKTGGIVKIDMESFIPESGPGESIKHIYPGRVPFRFQN